ncbi:unannotated protein [freshwater metagenome]|uniref:Unannotated protein n=1 Tax=freshwater metagenome TaxID=449393 RepID=A0A6J7CQ05_9ZZZZ
MVPRPDVLGGRGALGPDQHRLRSNVPLCVAACKAARLLRCAAWLPLGRARGQRADCPSGRWCGAHLQDGRHLFRGVRCQDAVPLLDLRGRGRGGTVNEAEGADPRLWPQPHRSGYRVRLLLRPRVIRAPGGGVRDGHGELQPRDGVDGLRHERPVVFRAAHARGRAQCDRRGDAFEWRGRSQGDRLPRWPDATEAQQPDPGGTRRWYIVEIDRPR